MVRNIKHCQNCGKCLDKRHRTKYCSEKCANEMNRKRAKERYIKRGLRKGYKEGKKKTHCIICGRFFIKKTANHKICSKECRKKQFEDIKNLRNGGNFPRLKLRFEIFKRDNFTCQYCGRNVKKDKIKLHVDHIYPKSKNGKYSRDNLITSCEECNLGKRDVLLDNELLRLDSNQG